MADRWKDAILQRNTDVTRIILKGDPRIAEAYIGRAQVYMGWLRHTLAMGGIGHGSRHIKLPNGVKIRVLFDGAMNIVEIFAPPTAMGAEEATLYVCLGFDDTDLLFRGSSSSVGSYAVRGVMPFDIALDHFYAGHGRLVLIDPASGSLREVYESKNAGESAEFILAYSTTPEPLMNRQQYLTGGKYLGEAIIEGARHKRYGFYALIPDDPLDPTGNVRSYIFVYDTAGNVTIITLPDPPALPEPNVSVMQGGWAYLGQDRLLVSVCVTHNTIAGGEIEEARFLIYRTDDFGDTWWSVPTPTLDSKLAELEDWDAEPPVLVDKMHIATSAQIVMVDDQDVLLFVSLNHTSDAPFAYHVIRSTDRGETFSGEAVDTGIDFFHRGVVLGRGAFLAASATRTLGLSVPEYTELDFRRTLDYGATWQVLSSYPTDPHITLKYAGGLTLVRPGDTPEQSMIVTPAFDGQQYRVFSSEDGGGSWQARGVISPTSVEPNDYTNNYGTIHATGMPESPLPVNLVFPNLYDPVT